MKQCDEQAAKDPKGLHYLVIPLIDEPRDEPGWRRISINDIGNAILINAEDMLAGLRRKALRISTDEYVFSTRNEATKDVLTWKPSSGVRKFVINDAAAIGQFRVQFQSNDAVARDQLGRDLRAAGGQLLLGQRHPAALDAVQNPQLFVKIERSASSVDQN